MARAQDFRGPFRDAFFDSHTALGISSHDYETTRKIVCSNDGSVFALCEGEIYNAPELYDLLKDRPENRKYEHDGFSLIPQLYLEQGREFAVRINGIFVLALWDKSKQRLFLYRDHLGSRSVFYHCRAHSIAFASTIRGLLALENMPCVLDPAALDLYFANLAVTPPATMFKNIFAIRPGHGVVFDGGRIEEFSYWHIENISEDYQTSPAEYAEHVRDVFMDAVALRAIGSDIGALVSGGVDTSAVVAALFASGSVQSLQGFSIAFDEKDFSDAPLQQIIYDRYAVQAHQIVLGADDFAEGLMQGSTFLDSPVNDTAYSGMYNVLCAAARQGCTAIFEGEGSDEIFCTGHSRGEYEIQKYLRVPFALRRLLFRFFIGRFSEGATLWSKITRMLARLGMTDLQRRSIWIPVFSPTTRSRLLGRHYQGNDEELFASASEYYRQTRLQDPLNIYQYGLTRLFLADDLLYKNERMASAAGVINRTPFIDYRLVELAFQIPAKYKMQPASAESDGTKMIFKEAIRGLVPDEILDRKKSRGFSQPTAIWYHFELKEFVLDHLLASDARLLSWIDAKEVSRICSDFMEGRITNDYFINSLLILELWLKTNNV